MGCIVKYKDTIENECYCKKLEECSKCSTGNYRKSDTECEVGINEYCTCRTCGRAVRGSAKD